jgi:N-acetyl-beta-hexosaminidase
MKLTWIALLIVIIHNLSCTEYADSKRVAIPLIPQPQSVRWLDERFDLKTCSVINVSVPSLTKEANQLLSLLGNTGHNIQISQSPASAERAITLRLGKVAADQLPEEAYRININSDSITMTANTAHGIFNGIQTLAQLIVDNRYVQGCRIEDFPAYGWRGYMVDVGRNYQSIDLLKQQIDQMARYKLNVFHFHLTEDIAWRLQVKRYPQLTAGQHMLRNPGKYYSVTQVQELIQYCRDRYITLVPEIDMPGHSAAFARAMGVQMQSEKGLEIVKRIVEEVCLTYDVPYLHIGADEVEITNQRFLPEVTSLISEHGKQVISWAPGGITDTGTIRQLWKPEGDDEARKHASPYIDSKFLYISDFDPLNAVVTIFNRQLGGRVHGDSLLLGAEFCLWADRRVEKETDLIRMNAVYPSMLAFAERSWQGGGHPGVVFSIGPDTSARAKAFAEFEKRLLAHKDMYFTQLPFNYVKQTHIKWGLFGPFENHGDLSSAYWPEKDPAAIEDSTASIIATGGTIWLWHTHGPPVEAWLPSPLENTTWYAYTKFWSDADSTIALWADFKDQSKSGADATPPEGQWDYMQSKLWINGHLTAPPKWAFPGRPSGQLEAPLVDEGFYYRSPIIVDIRKGWNNILVKLPMNNFDPLLDWQVPPKWMFTFIPVRKNTGINYSAIDLKFDPGPN